MIWRTRAGRLLPSVVLASTIGLGVLGTGCSTTTEDVHRWARTAQGPRKLVAVLVHEKYDLELRTEAALTLVRMKPRSGRRIGIETLLSALADMQPGDRAKIITKMVPTLETEIVKAPPAAQAGQPVPPDPATPYKDAAYAMLTFDGAVLVEDDGARKRLRKALSTWIATDFTRRLEDSQQMYGVEQVARYLGSDGVTPLAALIKPGAKKIDRLSGLISELGDKATKTTASKNLVAVATNVDSEKWIKQKAPAVEAANKASKLKPNADQFKKQLDQFQEEELLRVFASMKKVGGKPAVDFLLDYASSEKPEKRRGAALAALENKIDKNDTKQVEKILAIASADDTPPVVRGGALARVGEMPRKVVVDKLFSLFKKEDWKIRWVSAELVLKMSDASNIDEFIRRIGPIQGLAISEPIVYGKYFAKLKGKTGPELADKYAGYAYPFNVRATALSYYYNHGTKDQLAKIAKYEDDRSKAPEPDCGDAGAGCEWTCDVKKGEGSEEKELETLGDFVTYCVKPAMEKRAKAPPKKDDKKKDDKKKK